MCMIYIHQYVYILYILLSHLAHHLESACVTIVNHMIHDSALGELSC